MPESNDKIRHIDPQNEHAKGVADMLIGAANDFKKDLGNDFAGFALVAWDMQGHARTLYTARRGAVGRSLLPTFAMDNLSRHIAIDLVQEGSESHEVTPPDDPA